MRILQFITPSRLGGAELHMLELSRQLQQRGHQVMVICPRGRPVVPELMAHQIPHITPRTMGKLDPITWWRLLGWLRSGEWDLLHTHLSTASLLGGLAAGRVGVPVVATVHGLNTATPYRRTRHLIAVSQAVRDHLVRQGVPKERVHVIYHGITLPPVDPEARGRVRAELGIPREAFVVGSVGRLRPEKGHRYLLEAVALLLRDGFPRRLDLLLVGEGSERKRLEARAQAWGLADRVHLAGFQPQVAPCITAMDVVALPSLREGLSLAALEAMALERPVIASAVGGLPEVVVQGKTGLLVPPGQAAPLARAVSELAAQPELARALGRAGRERVLAYFTQERMVAETEEVYQKALTGGQAGGTTALVAPPARDC